MRLVWVVVIVVSVLYERVARTGLGDWTAAMDRSPTEPRQNASPIPRRTASFVTST
jgi:hypothetical protein